MKKLRTLGFALALVGCGSGPVLAQTRMEAAHTAVNSMAREILECAAYYDIVSLVMLRSNERQTSEQYVKARKMAVARADSLSPGISNTQYNAIIEEMTNKIAAANMPKKIDKSLSNVSVAELSVLGSQYSRLCKVAMNDPGERAKYWMEKIGAPPK